MNEKQKIAALHNWMTYRHQKLFKEVPFEEPDKKDKGILKDILDILKLISPHPSLWPTTCTP